VGDIGLQTAVEPVGDGRFTAMVHADWEIWGPCGGYVAALALRAAGAESHLARPASFFCHYLSVASFAPVDLEVTPLRAGRTVPAQRVAMIQEGRPVLDAMVWSVGDVEGLEHEDVHPPDVPDPDELPSRGDLAPDENRPVMPFWDNFEQRLLEWSEQWPPPGPLPPTWRTWVRPRPTPTFVDPWVDAAWSLIVLDVGSWPAGSRPHMYLEPPYIAPSLDLYASFQYPGVSSDWLLLDAHAPVAHGGLLSWTGKVWSRERRLVASGGGQAVFRHT
jgi:acyl-CoA thioesterase